MTDSPSATGDDKVTQLTADKVALQSGSRAGWYGVRTIYRWVPQQCYEERITVWRAISLADAIEQAEIEAREYETDEIEYLGFAQAYDSNQESLGDSTEIFSLLRHSALSQDEYLTRYFDTGNEMIDGNR